MTINEANRILNRVREGYPMPLAITTQALQRTGDIPELPRNALQPIGDEPCNDRAIEAQVQRTESRFSYSRYLDCPKDKGIKR